MSEVRHLWNCLIAKLNSRNGSSSLAKSGTLDNFCIASILECIGKPADWYERETWQRSTIYQGKHSRTAQIAAFTKIQRKFHCLRILPFKAGSSRPEGPTQRRVTLQTPPTKRTPSEARPALRQCERPRSGRAGDVSQQSRNSVQESRQDERS